MVAARRNKRRLVAIKLLQLKAQHATVEIQGFLDIRNFQVHVADGGSGGDGFCGLRHDLSLV